MKHNRLESVIITKNGLRGKYWDAKSASHKTVKKLNCPIVAVLRHKCEIDSGVTFGNIMSWVNKHPEIADFFSKYSWASSLNEYIKETAVKKNATIPKITKCEVYRDLSITEFSKRDVMTETCIAFHAIDSSGISYSLSLMHLGELKNIPVVINNDFNIMKLTMKPYSATEIVHKTSLPITLFEFLDAIFWEISWYGNRTNKDKVMESFNKPFKEKE
jgi:hypothetical protein